MDLSPKAEERRKALYSPFNDFMFQPTNNLFHDEVSLSCVKTTLEDDDVGSPLPTYLFDIMVNGKCIGRIDVRIGYSIDYYVVGQIGYGIDEPFRGNSYSTKACLALLPMLKAHGFKRILVTTDENNIASRRSCEKI